MCSFDNQSSEKHVYVCILPSVFSVTSHSMTSVYVISSNAVVYSENTFNCVNYKCAKYIA